jgi:hypothetical protein
MDHGSTSAGTRLPRSTYLPALPRVDVCAVVPAAGAGPATEWCEVRGLADGRAALTVGYADGPAAHDDSLRTAVLDHLGSADLAGAVERVAGSGQVCAVLLDPGTGTVEYAATGGLSLLVVRPDGRPSALATPGSSAIGPDDVLLLYVDGTAAAHDDDPVLRSAGRVALGGGRATEQLCCHLLDELVTGLSGERGLVLLAARRTPAPEPFDVTLPATAGSTGLILSAARDWLRLLGVSLRDRMAVDTVLYELCQDVVRHVDPAPAPYRSLRTQLRLAPTGVLETSVTDRGRRSSGDRRTNDRLALASAASDTLQVFSAPSGNRAVATHRVCREGPHVARAATPRGNPRRGADDS